MKQVLAKRGIQLTKSLGQNFLHDANQLRRIVLMAELNKSDKVLEVGPGLGPLTELLVEKAGEVWAIEKDARLVTWLQERFKVSSRSALTAGIQNQAGSGLVLLEGDALEYLRHEPRDWSQWKLVANLPYSVASPILVELAQAHRCPMRMVVTLQIEVAQRLTASPGGDDYGVLTLLVQLDYLPHGWFKIPASCFFPEPEVDSACVSLIRRPQPLLKDAQRELFARVVKRAFSQRRKMMFKLLKEDWPAEKLEAAFQALHLQTSARAETISLEQFVGLAQLLAPDSSRE